jgi:hypothetical protein
MLSAALAEIFEAFTSASRFPWPKFAAFSTLLVTVATPASMVLAASADNISTFFALAFAIGNTPA